MVRQEALCDLLQQPELLRSLYDLTGRAIAVVREARRHSLSIFDRPGSRLHNSVTLLSLLLDHLKELRQLADTNTSLVRSVGVRTFLSATSADLSDDYLEEVAVHLRWLKFIAGISATVRISPGNGITDYQVDRPGRSTFLRSVGLAQLLTQAGLLVPARSLRTSPAAQILTHFKREEDASLTSGKLDEELSRMSNLVPDLAPGSLILFNESFASTSEQEGSENARSIVLALTHRGIRVIYVTHMYQLAKGLDEMHDAAHIFLRTTLTLDGQPTYQLHPGAPERRSNGIAMYDRVFTESADVGEHFHL